MSDTGRTTISLPSPSPFAGFRSPNYTPVPDELFDELLSSLSGAELKVLLYIIRRTFGFKKQVERISLSQIRSGITTREGRVLDRGTGLSLSATQAAIKGLVAKGVITLQRNRSAEKGDQATTYSLRLLGQPSSPQHQPRQPHRQGDDVDSRTVSTSGKEWERLDEREGEHEEHEENRGSREDDRGRDEPAHLINSAFTPGTENRQGGISVIGTGGYRKSAPQETGSQQTEISVRNSKATRQVFQGEVAPVLDDTGGARSAGDADSRISPVRTASAEDVKGAVTGTGYPEQQPAASTSRQDAPAHDHAPRLLADVLAARTLPTLIKAAPSTTASTTHSTTASTPTNIPGSSGASPHQPAGTSVRPGAQRPRYGRVRPTPQVAVAVTEIAQEFGDQHHLAANCTQAMRLWEVSGRSENNFVAALYEARAITRQQPRVANRMSYFWTVVRDLVDLLDESAEAPAPAPQADTKQGDSHSYP